MVSPVMDIVVERIVAMSVCICTHLVCNAREGRSRYAPCGRHGRSREPYAACGRPVLPASGPEHIIILRETYLSFELFISVKILEVPSYSNDLFVLDEHLNWGETLGLCSISAGSLLY